MGRIIIDQTERFTIIGNSLVQDSRLTLKAKGMAALIFSLGDGWEISIDRLMEYTTDGRAAVRAAIMELEETGYLTRERCRKDDGTLGEMDYRISNSCMLKKPTSENLTLENMTNIINKPNINNPLDSSKEVISPSLHSVDIRKKSTNIGEILLSFGIEDESLEEAIEGWIESRKKNRKAPTERAIKLAINQAIKLHDESPEHSIADYFNHATLAGWAGIFPINDSKQKSPQPYMQKNFKPAPDYNPNAPIRETKYSAEDFE